MHVYVIVGLDLLLYNLALEIGVDWKELAVRVGMTFRDTDVIEMEAHTPKEQACKMLRLLLDRLGRHNFNLDSIHGQLSLIRKKKQAEQWKSRCQTQ